MTPKTAGRITGLIYLGVVATGIFTLAYAPSRLIVDGDPAATVAAISQNADLFRASIVSGFAMGAFFLALPFAFSNFLSAYGKNAARSMIAFVAASIPLSLLALAQNLELSRFVAEGAASPEAVAFHLAAYGRWMDMASVFWGLWLAPLGWLILKSGAVPRLLGVLLIVGCAGYLANYFGPMLYDGYDALSFRSLISQPGSVGEIGTCLWLLARGARGPMGN